MEAQASEPQVFERILCGVDGTPASLVAVRQALRLQDENRSVLLAAVANLAQAAHAGMAAPHAAELLQHEAEAALAEAQAMAPSASSKLLDGDPVAVLLKWPQTVVVGVDGSLESAAAFTVARSVAARFGGSVRAVASTKDQLDREAARAIAPELEEHGEPAVNVLVRASEPADLIVVGSRGLHGLKALGSVSERVAHQALSSVLVVRPGHT